MEIYRNRLYPDDITKVSLHVWAVPGWYRRMVSFRIRCRRKPDDRRLPTGLRPRLRRVAMLRFAHREQSGVTFRKGVGLVGRCIDLNSPGQAMFVRMDGDKFRRALCDGADGWARADVAITRA